MVSHPPEFIAPVSAGTTPELPRDLSPATEPKYEPLAYCCTTLGVRSPGKARPLFSVH